MSTPVHSLEFAADTVEGPFKHALRLAHRPTTLAQTGLSLTFLADLLGKHLAHAGVLTTSQVIERLALAGPIVDQILQFMRAEGRVEVRSRLGLDAELRYGLTDKGRHEAHDAMTRGGYVGPAPVPLADYAALVRKQSVHGQRITRAGGPRRVRRHRHRRTSCSTGSARP